MVEGRLKIWFTCISKYLTLAGSFQIETFPGLFAKKIQFDWLPILLKNEWAAVGKKLESKQDLSCEI